MKFRHVAHAQPDQKFALDVSLGGVDGRNRLLGFTIIARDLNVYACALAVGRQHDLSNVAQGYAGVTQLTFNDDADLLLQRLADPRPVVRPAPLLRHWFYFLTKNL